MFGKSSTIRKYKYKLRPALAKRYGSSVTYTKAQVDKTIDVMGFNKKHIHYAYFMYCDIATYKANLPEGESLESMNNTITNISGIGVLGVLLGSSMFSDIDSDSDGGGDGGFGGGDGGAF
ncbi:DUF6559 family protein [Pseudoalteromonas lipolytica]|uniref:Uncharacterized protein n=1 Tax=Pseudoalteromonas lipolytica TaxID=570156 RepID=A0A0N8HL10_9GAMM|nr:DUF6559 family protein [Pseudoalteromonas lipolytica]KPM85376.1 hypothetical protein AOG27_00880 [Pseudoalteromonas lipolytica]